MSGKIRVLVDLCGDASAIDFTANDWKIEYGLTPSDTTTSNLVITNQAKRVGEFTQWIAVYKLDAVDAD